MFTMTATCFGNYIINTSMFDCPLSVLLYVSSTAGWILSRCTYVNLYLANYTTSHFNNVVVRQKKTVKIKQYEVMNETSDTVN